MCGIAGLWLSRRPRTGLGQQVENMSRALAHRGPDSSGIWTDTTRGVGFGHTRLSILAPGEAGSQPMQSRDGRFVITFNGEIYNHRDLRRELSGIAGSSDWQGASDTETLLEAVAALGIRQALERTVGMFAFAIWDRQENQMLLARDRFGEKPLHYGIIQGDGFVFASELKAIHARQGIKPRLSEDGLESFLANGFVQEPFTIFHSIWKLPPGHYVTVQENHLRKGTLPAPQSFWESETVARHSQANSGQLSIQEKAESLNSLLAESVRGQRVADVRVGAFLSGGIDSALVTAHLQSQSVEPVPTFSVGFENTDFDESPEAASTAKYLGTEHTVVRMTSTDVKSTVTELPEIYDEPFADSSQIPTVLLSQVAKQSVGVALTGDGSDELFAGYGRYRLWSKKIDNLRRAPRFAASLLEAAGMSLDSMASISKIEDHSRLIAQLSHRLQMLGHKSQAKTAMEAYERSLGLGTSKLMTSRKSPPSSHQATPWIREFTNIQNMMIHDSVRYLPSDLLVKTDRAAMSVGLETRMPFLDHRIFSFAWSVSPKTSEHLGPSKVVVRQALREFMPAAFGERPKKGFRSPIRAWLSGPLKAWASDLLSDPANSEMLDAREVRRQWRHFLSGAKNHEVIWVIVMFLAWHQRWKVL